MWFPSAKRTGSWIMFLFSYILLPLFLFIFFVWISRREKKKTTKIRFLRQSKNFFLILFIVREFLFAFSLCPVYFYEAYEGGFQKFCSRFSCVTSLHCYNKRFFSGKKSFTKLLFSLIFFRVLLPFLGQITGSILLGCYCGL